jgi:hypothetical protein
LSQNGETKHSRGGFQVNFGIALSITALVIKGAKITPLVAQLAPNKPPFLNLKNYTMPNKHLSAQTLVSTNTEINTLTNIAGLL